MVRSAASASAPGRTGFHGLGRRSIRWRWKLRMFGQWPSITIAHATTVLVRTGKLAVTPVHAGTCPGGMGRASKVSCSGRARQPVSSEDAAVNHVIKVSSEAGGRLSVSSWVSTVAKKNNDRRFLATCSYCQAHARTCSRSIAVRLPAEKARRGGHHG